MVIKETLLRGGQGAGGAEGLCGLGFLQAPAENGDIGTLRRSDLHTHVTKTTKSQNGYFITGLNIPVHNWGIGGNSCAKKWCGDVKI